MNKLNMFFNRKFVLLVALALITSSFVAHGTGYAQTGCSVIPSSNNSITTTVSLSDAGNYQVWARLLAPDTASNSLFIQVDGDCAITLGDSSTIAPNVWTWVNYQNGNPANTIVLPLTAGDHVVKITEREGGVGLDRLVFSATGCVPTDTGDSCVPTSTPTPTDTPTPTFTPTPLPTNTPTPTPLPTNTPTPRPTNTPTPVLAIHGLTGAYYNSTNFTSLALTRTDSTINFNWGAGSPAQAVKANKFSVRWTGKVVASTSGIWKFYTNSDDGVRVWVNGVEIINNWTDHSVKQNVGAISLAANVQYTIRIDYYENTGSALMKLSWTGPGVSSPVIVPSLNLLNK